MRLNFSPFKRSMLDTQSFQVHFMIVAIFTPLLLIKKIPKTNEKKTIFNQSWKDYGFLLALHDAIGFLIHLNFFALISIS